VGWLWRSLRRLAPRDDGVVGVSPGDEGVIGGFRTLAGLRGQARSHNVGGTPGARAGCGWWGGCICTWRRAGPRWACGRYRSNGGEKVKTRQRSTGRMWLAAGSVMDFWPSHDYSAFMPAGSLQQRMALHWAYAGDRLRAGIERVESSQGREMTDERSADGGPT